MLTCPLIPICPKGGPPRGGINKIYCLIFITLGF